MSFYKRDGEELLVAPNFVRGPRFELFAETHAENTYPIEGWYWFDTLDEAMAAMQTTSVSISPVQAKIALHRAGLLETAEAIVAAAGVESQLAWASATAFERDSTLLNGIAAAMGLTSSQTDNLFAAAALIRV
jgi:hypothetical protein